MTDQSSPSLKKRLILMGALMTLLVGGLVGFNLFKRAMMQKYLAGGAAHPPPVVTAQVVQRTNWQPSFDTIGSLRAARGVQLSVEVAGLVRRVAFKAGDEVQAGQTLVEMVDDAERAAVQTQEAGLDLARLTLKRDEAQYAVHAISQAQLEMDRAEVVSRTAQRDQALALLARKKVTAPFAGQMGITTVNPGQYLNPGDKIASLQTVHQLLVDFNLPQQFLGRIAVGQWVHLSFEAWPGKTFAARVAARNPEVDASTRNVQVEARLEPVAVPLLPGTFAHVIWDYDQAAPRLTLPQSAIAFNPYGATVFVIQRGPRGAPPKVQQAFITTGATRGDQIVVLSGLRAGDEVVTSGQLKLKSGMSVAISTAAAPPFAAAPTPQEQ
ncbi:efflux RND transporter periplasmic adaptor subunit [Ferrovum sp.]|uniref:efflux RND transporter periplasmic adaptor subunit n=1 Tax=Ferrovum sp. TaxID=2609467 RepID=UPI0026309DBC|nr:efflux RND transporter periplasmic adaptor subunit [Ferrovum sp.]